MKSQKGIALLELIAVVAIIAVLVALCMPVIGRSLRNAKAWIWGAYAYENGRIEAYLNETNECLQNWYSTNGPKPYIFSSSPGRWVDARPSVAGARD